jgi:Flp pilus assembly protein TadD
MTEETALPEAGRGLSLRELFSRPGYMEALVFVVAVLAFIMSAGFPFLFDDRAQIVGNSQIRTWQGTLGYFASDVWHSYDPRIVSKYYRPLFYLWVRFNYLLFGLKPAGWHITLVLLHGASSVLAFRLGARLTGSRAAGVIAALLFALHPVHIESVAWISGMTDPLMACFLLAAMLIFLSWIEERRPAQLAFVALLYLLALLCKEPAIMALPVLALTAWLYAPQTRMRAKLTAVLHGVAAPAAVAVAYLALRAWILHASVSRVNALPVAAMLLSLPEVLLFYLRQSLFPVGLSFAYDFDPQRQMSLEGFWIPLLVAAAIAALYALWCYRERRHRRALLMAAAIFVAWLIPVLDIRLLDLNQLVHDRYLYLPVLGVCIAVSVAFRQWSELQSAPGQVRAAAFGALCVLLLAATEVQQFGCASELLLWSRAARIAPHNDLALSNLGVTLLERGEMAEGLAVFQRDLQYNPNSWNSNYNMAYVLFSEHEYAAAQPYIVRALEIKPQSPETLRMAGGIEMKLGKLEDAEKHMRSALELDPDDEGFHTTLGLVLLERGDRAAAAREFERELQMYPNNATARSGLQQARAAGGAK